MRPQCFHCGKNQTALQANQTAYGFNEAAVFPLRKGIRQSFAQVTYKGFNEAAVFPLRKGPYAFAMFPVCRGLQ